MVPVQNTGGLSTHQLIMYDFEYGWFRQERRTTPNIPTALAPNAGGSAVKPKEASCWIKL